MLGKAGLRPADVGLIIHGTTLATNALIQRSGARTALLTTAGHRDALEMAHEDRFEQYDVMIDRPRPLVPRYLRLPVRERLDRDGRVLIPLDESTVEAALPVLDEHGVESVAIGYLHAFVNPAHEQRTAEILQAARPDLSITLASEVCPEIREFERLSTACANAYVRPLMARYLERLEGELRATRFCLPLPADDLGRRPDHDGDRGALPDPAGGVRVRPAAPCWPARWPGRPTCGGCCPSTWAAPRPSCA